MGRARADAMEKMVWPVGGMSGRGACMGVPVRGRWWGTKEPPVGALSCWLRVPVGVWGEESC